MGILYGIMTGITLEELRSAYEREGDQKVKERMRLISAVMEGHSAREVAKMMMVSESKVNYWKRRFREEGLEGLRERPRSGRPPEVPRYRMERMRRVVEGRQYWMATEVRKLIRERTGVDYSLMHVTRILHSWGFSRRKLGKRYVNAASDRQVSYFKKRP